MKLRSIILARLEDLEDESFFANYNTTFSSAFLVQAFETPSVRRDTCSFLVHSASRWQELEKIHRRELSKADHLSLYSEAIKAWSKNLKTALSYSLGEFWFYISF